MNFRTVTCLIATLLFNVFDTNATFQKGYEIAPQGYNSVPGYHNYDQQSSQNMLTQGATGYPSAPSQYGIRQYGNSAEIPSLYPQYQTSGQNSYTDVYPAPEDNIVQSCITSIKNFIVRIILIPLRICRFIKDVFSFIFGKATPVFPQRSTFPLL